MNGREVVSSRSTDGGMDVTQEISWSRWNKSGESAGVALHGPKKKALEHDLGLVGVGGLFGVFFVGERGSRFS